MLSLPGSDVIASAVPVGNNPTKYWSPVSCPAWVRTAAESRRHPPPTFARAGSGHLPAQLPVGPRPPTGPGEPGVAGTGLGLRGGTRRRAVHHRPRFHHLRDLRTGQGGGPQPQPAPYLIRGLHRQAVLSPAAGPGLNYWGRHRRGADVPPARGPHQHRPWPPTAGGCNEVIAPPHCGVRAVGEPSSARPIALSNLPAGHNRSDRAHRRFAPNPPPGSR